MQLLKDIDAFPEKYFGGVLPEQQDDKAILAKFVVQLQERLAKLEDQIDILQTQESLKLYELWSQEETNFKQFLGSKKADLEDQIDQLREQIKLNIK